MIEAVKFHFNTEFEDPAEAERRLRRGPKVDPADEPRYSENQVAEIREDAVAEGVQEGVRQAREEGEFIASHALTAIGNEMARLGRVHDTVVRDMHAEAVTLALIIARKLAGECLARLPELEVEALIRQLLGELGELTQAPQVKVSVPSAISGLIESRISALRTESGFEGEIVVVADATLSSADCRVQWIEGGGERDTVSIETEVVACIHRYLDSLGARWRRETAALEAAGAESPAIDVAPAPSEAPGTEPDNSPIPAD
jgi:flagellar assembly protein FliH